MKAKNIGKLFVTQAAQSNKQSRPWSNLSCLSFQKITFSSVQSSTCTLSKATIYLQIGPEFGNTPQRTTVFWSVANQSVNTILFLITQAEQRKFPWAINNLEHDQVSLSPVLEKLLFRRFITLKVICISAIAFTFALWKSRPPIIDNKSQSSHELFSCTSSQKHHCTGYTNGKKNYSSRVIVV